MGGGHFVKESNWEKLIDKMKSDSSERCVVVGINGLRL